MGRNLPAENNAALDWLEAHIDQWQADPISLGLTQVEADELAAEIIATRANLNTAHAARDIAINATLTYTESADALRASAAPLIANIKNFAENASDPISVYSAASVLPQSQRSPAAAPTQPNITVVQPNPDGTVTIKWRATGPTGTIYNVLRKLDTERGFAFAGQGGGSNKQLVDNTIPTGTRSATYMVQGVRGQRQGPKSNPTVVQFGIPTATQAGSAASAAAA